MAGRASSREAFKRTVITISSSSSSGEEISQESQSSSEDYDPSLDGRAEEFDSSPAREGNERNNQESMSNRVIRLLQERDDLQVLTLMECKAYLRTHGLRLSGTRMECIQRIKVHWRLRDGNGEALYPRSSFTIDCTGDVCRGDVVLFTQKVYRNFSKVSRTGNLLGKRTVAGRIVKESYGATKQQHTFTVEVLWSKGVKKLAPLFPLLVKGRNLYKMKTFRQLWQTENERKEILAEKHKRGAAARLTREVRRTMAGKRKQNTSRNEGGKHHKYLQHSSSRKMGIKRAAKRGKGAADHRMVFAINPDCHYYHNNGPPLEQPNLVGSWKSRAHSSHLLHQNLIQPPFGVGESSSHAYAYPQNSSLSWSQQYHPREAYTFSSCEPASRRD